MIRWLVLALAMVASPAAAQVVSAPSSSVDQTARNAAAAAQAAIPTASTTLPPAVTDTGSTGTMTMVYALANHTHASKARKVIATSAADGSYTFSYSAAPFTNPPVCTAVAEVAVGVTDVVNVQIVGTPTTTSATFLVNRAQRSTQILNLVSITLLSIPSSPGATKIHAICIEP